MANLSAAWKKRESSLDNSSKNSFFLRLILVWKVGLKGFLED